MAENNIKKAKLSDLDISEIWIDIPKYEGWYQVSNFGNVKSLDRMVNAKLGSKCIKNGRILVPQPVDGYLQVRLCVNGKTQFYRIHQLVAICFIPNPNNYDQINHKNEIRDDNLPENLEWCTIKYNNNYGTRIKKMKHSMINGKNSKKVLQLEANGTIVKRWASMSEAERCLGISNSKITMCCKGKRKTAGGYKWEYYEQN